MVLSTLGACSNAIKAEDTSAAPVGPAVTGIFKGNGIARGQILGGLTVGPAQIIGVGTLQETNGLVFGSVDLSSSLGGKDKYSVAGKHYGSSLNLKILPRNCSQEFSFTGVIQGDSIVFEAGSGVLSCQFVAQGTISWDSFTITRQP
jgi:hypothetical protein